MFHHRLANQRYEPPVWRERLQVPKRVQSAKGHRLDGQGQSRVVKLHFLQSACGLLHGTLGRHSLLLIGVR